MTLIWMIKDTDGSEIRMGFMIDFIALNPKSKQKSF